MSADAWTANANVALSISLVAPATGDVSGLKTIATFNPRFTYPVFGDDETIFGYQNLKIDLRYGANDMRPNLAISYSKKFKAIGETEAADIEDALRDFLPEVAFQKQRDFYTAVKGLRDNWTPPGELVTTFASGAATYEVWKSNLADPAVKQLVTRIQIFVPLFIEGGTDIDVDDPDADRWTVFFLYQKAPVVGKPGAFSYVFAGYSTVYRFFLFRPLTPPASPSEKDVPQHKAVEELALGKDDFDLLQLPCRTRISQFLVIPPFQHKGLGPQLYSIIYQEYLKHPQTLEITVEDPNEAFDDMRDVADLRFLRQAPEFSALQINTSIVVPKNGPAPANIVDKAASEAVRRKYKIAPRQFYRVLEMHLMSKLSDAVRPGILPEKSTARATKQDEHTYKLWRLMVKKRLYIHNKDELGQIEVPERIEKLNETVSGVEFDFARLVAKAEAQPEASAASNGKRKIGLDDAIFTSNKKARVDDE
ncbi:acyl-CoA N-acyltransferase [Lasiosphaeria ovina]|uniref:Histone acetyltransferase type B catalytic subunit n=1 Tax=Lasiosphaeria ovina TaxID=92902 RepID=A0AAE0NEW6_9PEZI|nr:acyl-CoA N-acyltransferase [Lasiosphaeria ovina]